MAEAVGAGTVLITGTTSGVGLHATKALADRGWQVVTANRDPVRAAAAADSLAIPSAQLSHLRFDLADLDSVRAGAETLVASLGRPLDALVINAAVYKPRLEQPEKTLPVRLVTPEGIAKLVRLVQLAKAWTPMLATVAGRLMAASPEQPLKALCPIVVTPSGMTTWFRLEQPENK